MRHSADHTCISERHCLVFQVVEQIGSRTAVVDDNALRGDQQGAELFVHLHHAEKIDVEHSLYHVQLGFDGGGFEPCTVNLGMMHTVAGVRKYIGHCKFQSQFLLVFSS